MIDSIISIYCVYQPNIGVELLEEVILWASEGYLDFDESMHALQIYEILLRKVDSVPPLLQNYYLSRLLDNLSVLAQLEAEVKNTKPVSERSNSGWNAISRGKQILREDSEKAILVILKIHRSLFELADRGSNLDTNKTVLWATFGYFIYLKQNPIYFC